MKENKEFVYKKYLGELEAHAKTILEVCEDYGEEIGKLVTVSSGIEAGSIAQADAEKSMLLGVIRFMLDCYMQK